MTRVPGLLEMIYQPLYDTLTVPALCNDLIFFQKGIGNGKTTLETSMDTDGHLEYPINFELIGVSVIPSYLANPTDVKKYVESTWFQLVINSKDYIVVPLSLVTYIEKETTNPLIADKLKISEPVYALPKESWISIPPVVDFRVELNTQPTSLSNPFDIKVVLFGYYKRPVH
jgi:hypothetical protein